MEGVRWLPRDATRAKAEIPTYDGFAKVQGMLLARALDLPTLGGATVEPARITSVEDLTAELSHLDPRELLVRHDRSPEVGSYPQGGYVISLSELAAELEWYGEQGRLLIFLEPAQPLMNLYSGAVSITRDGVVQVEVVGPGFDASDLNRGFITPHEVHRFLAAPGERSRHISSSYIDEDTYQKSKTYRIRKVALKLLRRRHTPQIDQISLADARLELESSVWASLSQMTHLLGEAAYKRAPKSFLRTVLGLAERVGEATMGESLVAFSGSQINNGDRLVVWDIVFPSRKFALSGLAHRNGYQI